MADGTRAAVGFSIGATNLAAVTAERAVTRKPVLTLYGHRPSEVGVPSENPNLDEPGVVITDFVNRVGDPAGVVAADGSKHRSEALVADALRGLGYAATAGQPLSTAAVSYPAHWQPAAVDALKAALNRTPEWSGNGQPVMLYPDAAAAVTALQSNPGLPTHGIVAVCDFGGTGTSLTLVDAANGYQPVAATVRHPEFSGDLIDQALLNHVVAELSTAGSFDTSGTSAIGSLSRLRADCRRAKEQLSSSTVATLTVDLRGFRGDIQLTRAELDDAIRQPLDAFIAAMQNNLQRNGIQAADLAAIATVGGGANIPAVTTTLSNRFRVPVITAPGPQLTAAVGAALAAAYGLADQPATALAPTAEAVAPFADATTRMAAPPEPSDTPALAWSEADDDSGIMPLQTGEYPAQYADTGATAARPPLTYDARPDQPAPAGVPWYRRSAVVVVGTALVVLALAAAVMIGLRHTSGSAPSTPAPSVSTSPPASSGPGSSDTQNPTQSQPSDTNQAPSAPSSASSQSPSSAQTPPPSSSTQTTTQPSTSQATSTQVSPYPPNRPGYPGYPRYPGVPGPGYPGGPEPGSGGR